jgi:hypothetical protein
VALAASLAWHFANVDADLSFVAQGYKGDPDIYQFLAHLALVGPKAEPSVIDQLPVTGDYNIVLTTRPRGSIPTPLWNASYMIFLADGGAERDEHKRVPDKILRTR